jgi:uncharacterized protein (TIGR00299 family) protein
MRIAWFDCFSGISGDMTLGALVAAGWPAAELEAMPGRLKLEGVRVSVEAVRRGPFAATRVHVEVAEEKQPHRHLSHVLAILERAELPAVSRERASRAFRRLAEAEASVHGSTPEKVHFHEVGAADALVDIAGAIEGLRSLGVERVFASTIRLGGGTVMSQHGRIPVPAPATAALLTGAPVELGPIDSELTTPTGAAILATLVESWEAPPAFRVERVGVGAGGRDPREHPNVLRVVIGEAGGKGLERRTVAVLETALDDENPQYVAALVSSLLEAGALDAMVIPAQMKKGRSGMWLVVIAEADRAEDLAARILGGSTSLGVRHRLEQRFELPRRMVEVSTELGAVRLKVATLPDGTERAMPEFESVRAAAERSGRPLREVAEAALEAWRSGRLGV